MDFHNALNTQLAELTPQPWDYTDTSGATLTVIPAGLREAPGEAEVYLRVTESKTKAAEAAITTTDLPNLIAALREPITASWEHQPHYPDGTAKARVGEWLGALSGLALGPSLDGRGFTVVAMEDVDGKGDVKWAHVVLPEAQRLPLASALARALDVAKGWEG